MRPHPLAPDTFWAGSAPQSSRARSRSASGARRRQMVRTPPSAPCSAIDGPTARSGQRCDSLLQTGEYVGLARRKCPHGDRWRGQQQRFRAHVRA